MISRKTKNRKSRTISVVFSLIGLLVLSLPLELMAATELDVLVYKTHNTRINKSVINGVLSDLPGDLLVNIQVAQSEQFDNIRALCQKRQYDLVFVPHNLGQQFVDECQYEVISETSQHHPYIYVRKGSGIADITQLQTLGVTKHAPAVHFAQNELRPLGVNAKIKAFESGSSLILSVNESDIDGAILLENFVDNLDPALNSDLDQLHRFDRYVAGQVLASPSMNSQRKSQIATA